jgi:uncharacterized delta-60 repeat protein
LDTSFDQGTGPNASVNALVLQDDGKVIIAGEFTSVNGISCNHVARLEGDDGSVDTSFTVGTGPNGLVNALALQPDGKVIIGGLFAQVGMTPRGRIARLKDDGSLDTSFDTSVGASAWVWDVALQPDGKVLLAGDFTSVNNVSRNRVARLDEYGALDTSFDPGEGADSRVVDLELQTDGKVVIVGGFAKVNKITRGRIARLKGDGSVDTGFDASANDSVYAVALQQSNGMVLVGGNFTELDLEVANRLARLNGATYPVVTSTAPSTLASFGVTYNHTFTATGYPTAIAFSLTDGSLPPGLTLDPSGLLSGVLSAAGAYNFTVTASNYVAPSATQNVTLVVDKADTNTGITSHEPDPSAAGEAVTVEYIVSSETGTPTGSVTVSDGVDSCTGTAATGSCLLTFKSNGTKSLTASYAGDTNFNSSISLSVSHTVTGTIKYTLYLPMISR